MRIVVKRAFLALGVALYLSGCSGNSPTAPSPPPPQPSAPTPPIVTRIIALSGNLAFGDVGVDATKDITVSISNTGNAPLTVTALALPSGYAASWMSGVIQSGATQDVTVRFAPTAEQTYNGTLTVSGDHTSGTNTTPVTGTGTRPLRRGTLTDPAGDASPGRSFPTSPDLVGATIEASAGNLIVTVSFAPGTLPPNVHCSVILDIDENSATGRPYGFGAGRMGIDYDITFMRPRDSSRARIAFDPGQGSREIGTAAVTFPTANQTRIVIPLSLLGNDDGHLAFAVTVHEEPDATGAALVKDWMPELQVAPGRVR